MLPLGSRKGLRRFTLAVGILSLLSNEKPTISGRILPLQPFAILRHRLVLVFCPSPPCCGYYDVC